MTQLMYLALIIQPATSGYTIDYPKIQDLQEKGVFKYNSVVHVIFAAERTTDTIVHQFSNLYHQTKAISEETHCDLLAKHLEEQKTNLKWLEQRLFSNAVTRRERGLTGQLLTSIFGVNDEFIKKLTI